MQCCLLAYTEFWLQWPGVAYGRVRGAVHRFADRRARHSWPAVAESWTDTSYPWHWYDRIGRDSFRTTGVVGSASLRRTTGSAGVRESMAAVHRPSYCILTRPWLGWRRLTMPNKRASGQRRSSLLVRFEHRWPGVPERGRSGKARLSLHRHRYSCRCFASLRLGVFAFSRSAAKRSSGFEGGVASESSRLAQTGEVVRFLSPNQARQPMPVGRHDCIRTPSARHSCALRSAK